MTLGTCWEEREYIIIFFLPIILFSFINPRLLRRKLQQNFWTCETTKHWHLWSSIRSFGFVFHKIIFARETSNTAVPCRLASWIATWRYQRAWGTVENSLCKGMLGRENLAEGTGFERMCSSVARNRKFESIVLFGVVWQVTKDQIYKEVLWLLWEQP